MGAQAHALGRLVASRIGDLPASPLQVRPGPIQLIDMFSGCGGMSTGFMAVNAVLPAYRLLGAIDIDPIANATYAKNLGIGPREIDVAALARRPSLLRDLLGEIGYEPRKPLVMIGCAPCQGFSSHRNRRGARDPRNHLFLDFATIVSRLKPMAAVMENVPELLTNRYWPLVTRVRAKLETAGYIVRIAIVNMAAFGVPQERFRVLVLALRHPFLSPEGFLDRPGFRTVRQTIGALPKILPGERCPTDPMHFTAGHAASTVATIAKVPKNGGSRPPGVGPECLRRIEQKQGRSGYDDVYGRLYWIVQLSPSPDTLGTPQAADTFTLNRIEASRCAKRLFCNRSLPTSPSMVRSTRNFDRSVMRCRRLSPASLPRISWANFFAHP